MQTIERGKFIEMDAVNTRFVSRGFQRIRGYCRRQTTSAQAILQNLKRPLLCGFPDGEGNLRKGVRWRLNRRARWRPRKGAGWRSGGD